MRSSVLVTGGSGFIGSHVVDAAVAAGYQPRILDRRRSPWHDDREVETIIGDVCDVDDVRRAARGCSAICHLAAAADVGEVHRSPVASTELNAMGTVSVLEAARLEGIARVLYASTVWVYSALDATEVDEDALLPAPAHLYTAGKLSGELYCASYAELYGLEPTILRFGIPYGPRCRPAAVIPRFVACARAGEPLTIAGSGDQERAFVYVEDLAAGVAAALSPLAAGRTYNLAGRETTTVRELADLVCAEVGATEIVHTAARDGDLRGQTVNSDRALRELGWQPSTTMTDGLRRYVAWLDEHEASAAKPAAPLRKLPAKAIARTRRGMAALSDPAYVTGAAMISVASAAAASPQDTTTGSAALGLALLAVACMLPLASLMVADWPARLHRVQRLLAVFVGAIGVVVLDVLSGDTVTDADSALVDTTLLISAGLAIAVLLIPRRLSQPS